MRSFAEACLAALALTACGHSPEKATTGTDAAPVTVKDASAPIAAPARPAALPFRLDVTLSAELVDALDRAGRQLSLSADYYGAPKPGAPAEERDALGIWLGMENHDLGTRDQSVTFAGRFDANRVGALIEGDPRAQVSAVASGPAPGRPELVCSGFDEPTPLIARIGGQIHCELIRE